MLAYKLLTPGPLSTTTTVKAAMQMDHCTWDEDYKRITRDIQQQLLDLAHVAEPEYTSVLMQGSGSFGVESVLTSVISTTEKVLVACNGAYGERIVEILRYAGINQIVYQEPYHVPISSERIESILADNNDINHIVMVHCETTTGILNDIESVGIIAKKYDKNFIVDAMSSFGGMHIPMADWHISYLISSANKCIQGVPGFSFILAKKQHLIQTQGYARSLSLDLYAQWVTMNQDGKWRFTSPTHTVLAFAQALAELKQEGGISARHQRYIGNNTLIRQKLSEYGIQAYLAEEHQSPFITTFLFPQSGFDFHKLYTFVKARGYAIYPGKLTEVDTFRIGNIGEIYTEDALNFCNIIQSFLEETQNGTN